MSEQKNKWDLIKESLWKHWVVIFIAAIVLIPILLNWLIQWQSFFEFVGEDTDWLMFWVTYISAIASFAMVFMTWRTLKQNEEQLNEIKRQWEEQNRPKVFCSLETSKGDVFLVLDNISSCAAINVSIVIRSNVEEDNEMFNKVVTLLREPCLTIPPLQKKIINLYIPAYVDGNYDGEYIEAAISIEGKLHGTYKMWLSEINLIRSIDYSSTSAALEKLNSTIKDKRFL